MSLTIDATGESQAAPAEAYPSPAPLTPTEKQQMFRINAMRACTLSMSFTRDAARHLSPQEVGQMVPAILEVLSGAMMLADVLRQKLLNLDEQQEPNTFFNTYYDEVLAKLQPPSRTN